MNTEKERNLSISLVKANKFISERGFSNVNHIVYSATLGSCNYGLDNPDSSDFDSLALVLPSKRDVLMGAYTKRAQVLEEDYDIVVADFRDLGKLFDKASFSNIQALWALVSIDYSDNLSTWLNQEGSRVLFGNLKPLLNSTLGEWNRCLGMAQRAGAPVPRKTVANTIYRLSMLQYFFTCAKANVFPNMESTRYFSLSLGKYKLSRRTESLNLYRLKYGESIEDYQLSLELLDEMIEFNKREHDLYSIPLGYEKARGELDDLIYDTVLKILK